MTEREDLLKKIDDLEKKVEEKQSELDEADAEWTAAVNELKKYDREHYSGLIKSPDYDY